MSRPICLISDRFDQETLLSTRASKHPIDFIKAPLASSVEHWPHIKALIVRSGTPINEETLKHLPGLEVIVTATSGFDHINFTDCEARNIPVMHTPEANAQSAAEFTFAQLLSHLRKSRRAHQQVMAGNWSRAPLKGLELSGQTLGIIGFGRIGQKVHTLAKAFGMNPLAYDPYIHVDDYKSVKFTGYEELMRSADIVSYHVPLTTETRHMVKSSTLDWLKPDAILVNVSRGSVVCLDSLLKHMAESPEFSAVLDVFPHEPLAVDHALLRLPNLTLSPHIGASTSQALKKSSLEAVNKVLKFMANKEISDSLPPKALWASKIL